MARIRSIKPEFWSDAVMGELDMRTRLLFIALWSFADDSGRGRAIPKELAGFAFPFDDDVTAQEIRESLATLSMKGRIILYDHNGNSYYAITRWEKHQKVDRPTASRLPAPPDLVSRSSRDSRESLANDGDSFVDRSQESGSLELGIRRADQDSATAIRKKSRGNGSQLDSAETWEAFQTAYRHRYRVEHPRNSTVNSQMCQFIQRIGINEAPSVAAFYVNHPNAYYVQKRHTVGPMLHDAESLRTDWATGRASTNREARDFDRLSGQGNIARELIAELKADGTLTQKETLIP